MPSGETPRSQIPIGDQDSRESESRLYSVGRFATAFVATALVATGTLVATGALLLIAALIPMGIRAEASTSIPWRAK